MCVYMCHLGVYQEHFEYLGWMREGRGETALWERTGAIRWKKEYNMHEVCVYVKREQERGRLSVRERVCAVHMRVLLENTHLAIVKVIHLHLCGSNWVLGPHSFGYIYIMHVYIYTYI